MDTSGTREREEDEVVARQHRQLMVNAKVAFVEPAQLLEVETLVTKKRFTMDCEKRHQEHHSDHDAADLSGPAQFAVTVFFVWETLTPEHSIISRAATL